MNGLDPDGVLWMRNLLRSLAAEGRTVFLSSHLISEMALTAERLVVVGRGRLLADTTVTDLIASASKRPVRVRPPRAAHVGALAASHGWELHELYTETASLEEVYMSLTHSSRDFGTQTNAHDSDTEVEVTMSRTRTAS